MKESIVVAGFGGQGILLVGQILAEAAMIDGLHTTWFPSYGPEMRGGTANCTTIISDEEIGSPISARYDAAIVMNQPSLERFGPAIEPGGALLVNASMVPVRSERTDLRAAYVAAADIARQVGNERVANVIMLGALLGLRPVISLAAADAAIQSVIGKKHPQLVELNQRAMRAGRDAALSGAAPGSSPVTTSIAAPVAPTRQRAPVEI
ncbi:MAG: 2-oxoacid:acceptor oxidoreductase family protein [Phycisphaerae bacterium]